MGALRSSLSKIMALMSSLTDMGVILLETSKTYNLEDFYGIQEERVDTFRKDLQNFRSVIKRIVYDACKATFSQSGFSLDDYRIECNYLQRQLSDNTSLSPEARYEVPKKLTFIEQSNKRLICEKLISFVHLVDWIFRIALYNCVKNTFDSIHMEMESRSAQFVIEADDGKKGKSYYSVLVLEKYLHKLNEAINSIQLIIHDKDLNPFTRPYLYGKIDESLIQVPRDILISNHESSIRDIIKAVCNTLSKSYIICKTIFDPYEKTCEEFSEYPSIESQDNSEMTVSTDVEQLKGDMHSLTTQQKNIRELKDSFSLGLFKADFRPFKRRLLPNISKAFSKLQEALPQLGREKISSLSKCIKEVSTLAEFEPESAKDMFFAIMEKIPLPIPPEEGTAINNLKALMTSLNTIIDKREQREANKILRLSTALQEEENVLKTEISVLLNEIKSPQLTESSSSPQEIRESLLKHRNELCNVEERANVYKYYEKEFGFEITEYLEIIDANKNTEGEIAMENHPNIPPPAAPPIHMIESYGYKKEFKCQYCHKSFEKRICVNRHIKNVHEATREYVECYLCHKNFAQKHYLATHIKTVHHGVKEFKCMYCEKEYGQKSQLNLHVKTVHQRIRDYACPQCDKTFAKKDTLKFHMKTVHQGLQSHVDTVHKGIKKHKCQGCNKPYALKQGLKLHTCSHSKDQGSSSSFSSSSSSHDSPPTQIELKPTYATLNPTTTKVAFPAQHIQNQPPHNINSIERLWNRVEDWGNRCKEWYSIEFPTLDVEVCYDYTRKLVEEILEIRESLGKENEVLSKLEEEVTGLKSKIPCIRDLRSGSLRARHWKMISELIGMELESNSQIELTLESLDQYGVYSYHKEISKITKSAIEEEKLDNLIRELNDIWTKTRVETRVRHGILIVDNFDFLFNTWESSFITLRQLGKSRYLQQFNERLLTWSGRLEFVKTFIELLKSVQNLWAIQDVPFSCLMFKEELPSVHEYFQRTKAAFVLAMNTIIESPNILESFHNEDNYFILTDIKLHFTKTQSHLTDSLRATRLSSPRLFFLSDEELLRLLENSVGNLSALNPYLYLMFTSVQSVLFTEGDSHERCYNPFITGVCSKGGEKLMFDEPVKARLDVPHWIKTIDGDIYRTLLLELQDIMRKGIASFPQVWRDKNYLAQSQSNAAHVFWSANKDINLKELKEHCIQSIDKNTSNPSIRIKEARKLLQLLYYEQDNHSNRHDLEYVYDGNRLKVSGFGNAIQYGTEYLGYDLPFNPELTLYCPSELFHEFGVSQNAKTQRLLAGLLGKFFFSLSHFNPDLNLQNVVLGTIKLGSWTFLRDFEYVQEEDVLFLKEISIYCQLMMKDNNNLGKRFINVGGYEIPMGMFPRLRMDSIQISRLLEPFSNNQNIDYQNKIMSALGKCTFETETDFIFYCVDKVKTLDEMKNIEHNELSHILGESWMEKFRSSETISSKLDSSFNLIVLNATELQSAVENFTCTVLNLPESMTKQKTISLSLRYLENQGYSIIKICPVSQILHPSLHLYINSIIEASNGKVVFLLHGPWNQEWVIYIGKVLMYYSNLRFILSDDSNKSEECGSKRSVQLMYDEIEEFKIIGHELSQKDFDIMYKNPAF
ncbi:DNAH [Lepeophtheirus salmonis]|uniref:DNAH n=2 Tax=Lepeophtheirus salmonis TaxID=72036 RepID=A0A7R8D9G4_LEPSM|nr:DNAH [Lepeophtheirus salmonis]CAF3044691.1 DNAH [Lepeophtheirus salmonis]